MNHLAQSSTNLSCGTAQSSTCSIVWHSSKLHLLYRVAHLLNAPPALSCGTFAQSSTCSIVWHICSMLHLLYRVAHLLKAPPALSCGTFAQSSTCSIVWHICSKLHLLYRVAHLLKAPPALSCGTFAQNSTCSIVWHICSKLHLLYRVAYLLCCCSSWDSTHQNSAQRIYSMSTTAAAQSCHPRICGRTPRRWPSCWHNGAAAWLLNKPRDSRTTSMLQEAVPRWVDCNNMTASGAQVLEQRLEQRASNVCAREASGYPDGSRAHTLLAKGLNFHSWYGCTI